MQNQETIGGYRLRQHLQTGQSSQVYEVVELSSNRHFAMKILLPEAARKPESRAELFHEAEVGLKLKHENVIRIVKVVREYETPYFIMEFFSSGSLRRRMMDKEKEFIQKYSHTILRQAATGLAFMNASGWVHRDVKPDNLLINSAGQVRIIDFAIAQKIPTGIAKWFYRPRKAAGTPSYMSPEQLLKKPLDGRADIYSFGAMSYEIAVSKPPFRGSSPVDLYNRQLYEKPIPPKDLNSDVTDEMSALIIRMLGKKPEDRPRDFHEVLMALRNTRIFKSQPMLPTDG